MCAQVPWSSSKCKGGGQGCDTLHQKPLIKDSRLMVAVSQVEMWLHATSAAVNGQLLVDDGDSILMEVSRKFTMANIRSLAFRSGWYVQVTRLAMLKVPPTVKIWTFVLLPAG